MWTSIYLLVAVVVGGRVSIVGALLGAAFIETIPYESASVPALANLLMGALLIVVLVLRPNGLRSLLVDLLAWLTRIVPRCVAASMPSQRLNRISQLRLLPIGGRSPMNSSEAPLLEVDGVVAGYRGDRVLNHVSMHVRQSSVVALLGANGVGKTTLLRAVAGMVPCREGSIKLDGSRIDGLPHYRISRFGVSHVPEGRGIFPGLSVRDNLRVASFAKRRRPDLGVDGIELFPVLRERMNQRGGTLSGGEQQMLAIARALATSPRILLLDEPSLGLAPQMVSALYAALHSVKQNGVSDAPCRAGGHRGARARRLRVRDRDRRTGPR